MELEKFYTTTEVKEILRISESTLRRYIRDGKLITQKVGTRHKISESNLKKLIEPNEKQNKE